MAQDDYYYEIQLTNKQLVFYFMAGATGLILSFLAGVMVGRGLDGGEVQASRPLQEDRIVAEEAPLRPSPAPAAGDLSYAQRLESEKPDESLERPKPSPMASAVPPPEKASLAQARAPGKASPAPVASAPAPAPPRPAPSAAGASAAQPSPPPKRAAESAPKPGPAGTGAHKTAEAAKPTPGTFTIQVGAFKDKATADSVVARLKGKGFTAYVLSPGGADGGLFVVRVGSYTARADAERAEAKLRDQEKFKPYIVKY